MSAAAAAEWDALAPSLTAMRVAKPVDATALALHCEAVARWRMLAAEVDGAAPLIRGRGGVVRNPLFAMVRDAEAAVLKSAREFGLTPSSRMSVRVDVHHHDDSARLLTAG
jgi:P27 family predicted phage terminase small subunit